MLTNIFFVVTAIYLGYCFFDFIVSKDEFFTLVGIWCGMMSTALIVAVLGDYCFLIIMMTLTAIVFFGVGIANNLIDKAEKKKASR